MLNKKKIILISSSALIVFMTLIIGTKANNFSKNIKKEKIVEKVSLNKTIKSDKQDPVQGMEIKVSKATVKREVDFGIKDYSVWSGNKSVGILELGKKYNFNLNVQNLTGWKQVKTLNSEDVSIVENNEKQDKKENASNDSNKNKSVTLDKGGTISLQKLNEDNVEKKSDIKPTAFILNVYPDSEYYIPKSESSYTTFDGEVVEAGLPYSADLKKWMEFDTITGTVDGKTITSMGAGMGALKILPVSITEFNNNPTKYINKQNGKYYSQYGDKVYELDSIFFGNWDSYAGQDLSDASYEVVEEFSQNKPIFLGHDTVQLHRDKKFNKLVQKDKSKLFIKVDPGAAADVFESPPGDGVVNKKDNTNFIVGGENIRILRGGDFIQYPWLVASDEDIKQNTTGGFGKKLKVPGTHVSFLMVSKDNVYADFIPDGGKLPGGLSDIYEWKEEEFIDDENYTNNFYLAEKNGVCMIQTGHSNNQATSDEKKLIANILSKYGKVSNRTPIIENFSVDNVTEKGFNARVKVSDEGGVQMIKFAVWREGAPDEIKWIEYKQTKPYQKLVDLEKEIKMSIIGAGADIINIGVHAWDDAGVHSFGGEYKFKIDTESPTLKVSNPTTDELPEEYKNAPVIKIEATDNFNSIEKVKIIGSSSSEQYDLFNTSTKILNLKVNIADDGNSDIIKLLTQYGFNNITTVTSIPSISQAKQYDVIVYDNGAHSIPIAIAKFLNSASDAGVHIFTKANDTGITEYEGGYWPIKPVKSAKRMSYSYHNLVQNGSIGLSPNRIYDNICYYINPPIHQYDVGSMDVVEMGENTRALAIDTNAGHNAPNFLYYMSDNGTKWIHAQVFGGLSKGNGRVIDELMIKKTSNPVQYKTYIPVPKNGTYIVEIEDFFGNTKRQTIDVQSIVPEEDLEVTVKYKAKVGNGLEEKIILNETTKKVKVPIGESLPTDFDFTIPNENKWIYATIEAEVIHPKDTTTDNNKLEVTIPINNDYKPPENNSGNLTTYPDGVRCILKKGSTILVKAIIPYNKVLPFGYNAENLSASLYIDGSLIQSKAVYGISARNEGNVYFTYTVPKDYKKDTMNIRVTCENGKSYSKNIAIKKEYTHLTYEKMPAINNRGSYNISDITDSVQQMGQKNVVAYLSVDQLVKDAPRWKACANPHRGAQCNKAYYGCSQTPPSEVYVSSHDKDLYKHDPNQCPVCKSGNQKNWLKHIEKDCQACKHSKTWPNYIEKNPNTSHGYPNKYGCTKGYHENCWKYSNNGTNGCVLGGYWDCQKYSRYVWQLGYTSYGCRTRTEYCSYYYGDYGSGCILKRSFKCSGCTSESYSCGGSHYSYTNYCSSWWSYCKDGGDYCDGHDVYSRCYYDCVRYRCYTTHYEYYCPGHSVYYCGVRDAAHAWYDCPRNDEHGKGWYCPNDANHQHVYECKAYAEGSEGLYFDWYEPVWEKDTQGWKTVYIPVEYKQLKNIKEQFTLSKLNFRSKYTKENGSNSDGFVNVADSYNARSFMKVKAGYGFDMEFETTYTNTFPKSYGEHTVTNSFINSPVYNKDTSWVKYRIIGTQNAKLPLIYKNIDSSVKGTKPLAFASPSIHDILIDNPEELYLKFPNSEYRKVDDGVEIKTKKKIDLSSSTTYKETISYQLPNKLTNGINRKYYIDKETQNGDYPFKVFTKKVGFGVECNNLSERLSENKDYKIQVNGGYLDDIKTHLNE